MAEPDAAVTDTHPLLFHAARTGRLGPRAAVLWETSLLARVGRVHLRRSVAAFFDDLFSNPAYQPLDLTPEHVYAADDLHLTRNPFDALIVASAQVLGLTLVTRDGPIRDSGTVAVLW